MENRKPSLGSEPRTKKKEEESTKLTECPVIQKVTAADKQLPYDQRLQLLEDEFESLYEFCLTKHYSKTQIQSCLSPFVDGRTSIFTRIISGSTRSLFILATLVVAFSAILKVDSTRELLTTHLKIFSLKTLHIYDWRHMYDEDCLVYNTYLEQKNLTKNECYACIDYGVEGSMDRLKNASGTEVTKNYLSVDWPFIVSDVTRDWPRDESGDYTFSIENIQKLYETHGALRAQKDCLFVPTHDRYTSVPHVLKDYEEGKLPENFHIVWQNCEPKAAKVFRRFTERPYFFPSMVEALPNNMIILTKGNVSENWFPVETDSNSAIWLVVVEGELRINIRPVEDCIKYGCMEFDYVLHAGEAVVIPTRVFMLEYTSSINETTLAFSSAVLWDEMETAN